MRTTQMIPLKNQRRGRCKSTPPLSCGNLKDIPLVTPLAAVYCGLGCVADAWAACGGVVGTLEAARHDEIFAAVSHLPHALAFALVAQLAARADAADYFRYAATGFRDFTRLASSDPEMWRDVCLGNATALRRELSAYRAELDRLDALLVSADGDGLIALFERARVARNAWLARHRDAND